MYTALTVGTTRCHEGFRFGESVVTMPDDSLAASSPKVPTWGGAVVAFGAGLTSNAAGERRIGLMGRAPRGGLSLAYQR